ncbi:helix-turn-helix transcriptional regulator [Sphingobium sp. AN641]|uniref:helix-turn-helix transcriptional regulator n=1 Tax=Sphingobium sp. AN641 TaxID=3133443 RepID=UPI0030BB6FBF
MANGVGQAEQWSDRFLQAALDPRTWHDALAAMAAETGSSHGQLIGFGPGAAGFNWVSGMDADQLARAASIDADTPDQNYRVVADSLSSAPAIVHEAHYDIVRRARGASDYVDMCADLDIMHGCQTRLIANDDVMVGLALLRSEKDGRTSEAERASFTAIAPHARTAARMQRAIEQQGFALLAGTFETMDRACWLLDATGMVRGMTPRAEMLYGTTRLRLADGRLASSRADETRRIQQGAQDALERPGKASGPIPLADDAGGVAVILEAFPLPARAWEMNFAPRAILVGRVGMAGSRHVQALTSAFRLTPAEADIAVRLAAGETRPQIAAARGVSPDTLKVQIRNIYDKTGCNRESQLVRIVGLLGN